MLVHQEEEHVEVDFMRKKQATSMSWTLNNDVSMSAIQRWSQKTTKICHAECLIVELIAYVTCDGDWIKIKMNVL